MKVVDKEISSSRSSILISFSSSSSRRSYPNNLESTYQLEVEGKNVFWSFILHNWWVPRSDSWTVRGSKPSACQQLAKWDIFCHGFSSDMTVFKWRGKPCNINGARRTLSWWNQICRKESTSILTVFLFLVMPWLLNSLESLHQH